MSTDGERLDRVQLLRERAAPRHAQRRHGVGQRSRAGSAPRERASRRRRPRSRPASSSGSSGCHSAYPKHGAERHHHARRARTGAGSARARAASEDAGTRAPRRRSARRSCPRRPRVDRVRARALDRERARAHLVARDRARPAATRRSGSTRRARARPPRSSTPSATTWSPACEPHEVARHDLLHVDRARLAVAHDRRVGRDERREPVERPLRAQLLRRSRCRRSRPGSRGRARPASRRTRA